MRIQTRIFFVLIYAAFMLMAVLMNVHADQFMSHEQIMDGFVHAQKAPQMGRPMIYLPSKDFFGKKHKKGAPHGEQKFGRGRVDPSPAPSSTPGQTPTATPGGGQSPTPSGAVIISDNEVDLRARDSSIKDQIGPICTAYAGNAGVENLLGPGAPDFSEDYTFSLYGKYSVDAYSKQVPGKPLALNSYWPRGGAKKSPFATTNNQLVAMTYLGDGEIDKAKAVLKTGKPVYLGLEVPADMASCLASIRPTTRVTSGGHAVLIVGFRDDASNAALGGGYFTIKNSWGSACADNGYFYLPYSYCKKSYCYVYSFDKAQ